MRAALIALVLLPAGARAADFQPWAELGLRWDVAKRFRVYLDQHLRLDEEQSDGSPFARHDLATEVAVRWRAHRLFRLKAGYRYTAQLVESNDPIYVDSYHRFFADAHVRWRTGVVVLHYRLRLQERFGRPWVRDEWRFTHTIRNEIGAELRTELGAAPFAAGELFARVDGADGPWHKWRLSAGLDWALGDHVVTAFYHFEDMLNDPANPPRHIVGVAYHYELGP